MFSFQHRSSLLIKWIPANGQLRPSFDKECLNSLGIFQLIIITILQLVQIGLCRRRRRDSAHETPVGQGRVRVFVVTLFFRVQV